ncbi:hypothetical protein ANCDUO_22344 [Ancylostoma duodenale]|uniref:7TM GPCR serpentine receptor class x (Srx) domain-containing protein n=1 Tax=Ancylostoma duodenale TaxID=51022 RepID=A0A0C2CCK4_9BILA|nr:hypothetical protein ANCDUO_22344 [Ancylostoma duodenale]
MSYFIHNAIITILRNQRYPKNNNLLNNFRAAYPYSAVARVLILFQLITIMPLILFFIRSQISCAFFDGPYPG